MHDAPTTRSLGVLLAKASQRWNECLTDGFAARGFGQVRASYGSVLLPLWAEDGLRMGTLAVRARLSKQTMTTLVRLAERDGLVARKPDATDGRATRVWLTPLAVNFAPIAGEVVDELQRSVVASLGARRTRPFATSPAEVIAVLSNALRDGRVADALALYEPDAVFIPQPKAQPIAGRAAIQDALTTFAALQPQFTSNILSVVIAGDVATVVNDWRLSGTAPDGSSISMNATSADVMRRRADNSWGILIDNPWALAA